MKEQRNAGVSDIVGSSSTPCQTETSPLKQTENKENWFRSCFGIFGNENEQGSLKTISLNFFGLTAIITLGLLAQIYYGGYEIPPHGSVASDSHECSQIGIEVIRKGGNAVDAAIASTICLGVVNFHVTGLGGGGSMMIYNHKNREVIDILDFHSIVPKSLGQKNIDPSNAGSTVGVPGLLMGLWDAHEKYGHLPWVDLIMPSSNLAKYGFIISKNVISARNYLDPNFKHNKNLINFFNSLKEGQNTSFPELADTLKQIAFHGAKVLYNGSLAMDIIYSVKEAGGSMTLDDIAQYHTTHSKLLHTKFGIFDVLAPGPSTGGALLLNALDSIQFLDLTTADDLPSIILKLSDILHDAYISFIEKNEAVPLLFEPVASQVSAVDNEELYVAVVTGLNTWLGSQLLTSSGFLLNNALVNGGFNDNRRPMTLSTPIIALESNEICGKRLILGAGDATIAAQVLTNALILNHNLSSSVESPRFYIDNVPRHIRVEDLHFPFFDQPTLKKLRTLMKIDRFPPPYKSLNVIQKIGDTVTGYSDSRGGGVSSQFK